MTHHTQHNIHNSCDAAQHCTQMTWGQACNENRHMLVPKSSGYSVRQCHSCCAVCGVSRDLIINTHSDLEHHQSHRRTRYRRLLSVDSDGMNASLTRFKQHLIDTGTIISNVTTVFHTRWVCYRSTDVTQLTTYTHKRTCSDLLVQCYCNHNSVSATHSNMI